jgi:hypothetical protein
LRRVPGRVRERLLGDPVGRDADGRRDFREVAFGPQLDGETSVPRVLNERGDLTDGRQGRRRALIVAAQQRDRAAQLVHAATTDVLRRPQSVFGGCGVSAQHVPGAGHLEHHGGQPVANEVVDVTSDPASLGL